MQLSLQWSRLDKVICYSTFCNLTGRLAWSRRSTVGWSAYPHSLQVTSSRARPPLVKGGQANWCPSLGLWGSASLWVNKPPLHWGGPHIIVGGQPGSGADGWPVGSWVRRWGLFGSSADGWLERRLPGRPCLSSKMGWDMVSKYQDPPIFGRTWGGGWAFSPQGSWHVPALLEGGGV